MAAGKPPFAADLRRTATRVSRRQGLLHLPNVTAEAGAGSFVDALRAACRNVAKGRQHKHFQFKNRSEHSRMRDRDKGELTRQHWFARVVGSINLQSFR